MTNPIRIDVMHELNVDAPQNFVGNRLELDDVDDSLKPYVDSGYVCTEQFTANGFGSPDKWGSRIVAIYRPENN